MKKEQQMYVLIGVIVCVCIYAYINFLLGPINRSIREKKDKIKEIQQTLETAKREVVAINELRVKSQLLQLEVADLQKLLPRVKDIPELLRVITKDAQKFNIKINNLQPEPVVTRQEYDELPFSLNVVANFHSLANFLAELGQEDRLMSMRNISMNTNTGGGSGITISANFTLVAYMAKGGR